MKRLLYLILIIGVLFTTNAWCAEHPLLSLLPGEPLVVLSGQDLKSTYNKAMNLDAVKAHGKSFDRKTYDDSKLQLKLNERFREFGEFVGHKIDRNTLLDLAGKNTVLALYDIGELKFLLVSDLSATSQAALGYLTKYESLNTRKVGSRTFFVKEDPDKGLSFALYRSEDMIMVSNEMTLIEGALLRADDPNITTSEKVSSWINNAKGHPEIGNASTMIALNMGRLIDDRYFRNYWTFHNRKELTGISDIVIGLDIEGQKVTENRLVIGQKERKGKTLTGQKLKAAWWSEAGPAQDTGKELDDFLGWKIQGANGWKGFVQGRLLAVNPIKEKDGVYRFAKSAALLIGEKPTAKEASDAILKGALEKLFVKPDHFSFTPKDQGVLALEVAPGFAGAYVAKEGNILFMANDEALLVSMMKNVQEYGESSVQEAAYMDMENQLPDWVDAFQQMGPDAAFDSYNTGYFFSKELSSLLKTMAEQGTYFFESRKLDDGSMLQKVIYGQ